MQKITVFTDGSSLGNPGPGGYGVVIVFGKETVVELGGHSEATTNNRMEMTAAIEALKHILKLQKEKSEIVIYSDSSYVIKGITEWVHGWQKNNWINSARKVVLNRDLWEQLIEVTNAISKNNSLSWNYVKGHAGILGNERVDTIATTFAEHMIAELFVGDFSLHQTVICGSVLDLSPVYSKKK